MIQNKKKFTLLSILFLSLQIYAQDQNINFQSTIKVEADDSQELIITKAAHVVPTANQYEAMQNEFIAFLHFGPNTFTRMEWGDGKEDPKVFDLKELHTDQWCEAMKAAGIRLAVLTVKHHDGFCLWQSRYTKHGIMSTGFRDGRGDVLKELSESCRKYGIKLGIYLSPADLYQIENSAGLYGNLSKYTKRTIPREIPRRPFDSKLKFEFEVDDYNEYFLNQLYELLTEYGPIYEVWFDGAHPKRKGNQKYNYTAWRQLIRTLAPHAVVFGREDIRWCGNEGGATRETEWNVIPYPDNPNTMNEFWDITEKDVASRERLFGTQKPFYLHYQPAETNTSIRDGWFYRDDIYQNVRSADDVFDIWERSVGGNSYFMLNIPPNREGRFSERDVAVLEEVGKHIRDTYGIDLLAKASGAKEVLDHNMNTWIELDKLPGEIIISTREAVTFNRLEIREPVAKHGERVEKHAVDAFIDGRWKEIATATNIGNRRILRLPEITTDKIRVRILESRLIPAISSISAYRYKSHSPALIGKRNLDGMMTIEPQSNTFLWNYTGQNAYKNLNSGYKIYYTINGKEPDDKSTEFETPFKFENGELKAVAYLNGEKGPVYHERFGHVKKTWKVIGASGEESGRNQISYIIDENPDNQWLSQEATNPQFVIIDLGKPLFIKGFAYTPPRRNDRGMMEEGVFQTGSDGKTWKNVESFRFGNLINDPTKRYHYFNKPLTARYIRIEATKIAAGENVLSIAELDLF